MNCFKKNKIKPVSEQTNIRSNYSWKDFHVDEKIPCQMCDQTFLVSENKVIAQCNGCNRLLHCGIAGKCIGPNCYVNYDNICDRLTWCIDCVPKSIIINRTNNSFNDICLCSTCYPSKSIPRIYKRKI